MDVEAGWGRRTPVADVIGFDHLPSGRVFPELFGARSTGAREDDIALFLQRLEAACAVKACRYAGGFFDFLPEGVGHQKAFQLELFLVVPNVWRVRLQGSDDAAGGSAAPDHLDQSQ